MLSSMDRTYPIRAFNRSFSRLMKYKKWFIFGIPLILALGAFALVSTLPPSPISAHSGDVWGPACGVATIDGQVNDAEWTDAASKTFQMYVPGAGTPFTGTLKVMNGAAYLYFAFTVNDDEFSTVGQYLPRGDAIQIVFDNDHSGTLFQVDDDVLNINAGQPQFEDNYIVGTPNPFTNYNDTAGGGTTDGWGAAQRVGSLNHFEGKHPLCSGDTLDFCLHPGETVGFRVEYLDAEGNGSFGGNQFFPGSSSTSEADIVIGDCNIPDLFLFLPVIWKSP